MSKKVLVVDDEDGARRNMERHLKHRGFEVFSACNANEAISLINENRFDVIVTDMVMETDKAGEDVLDAAKKRNKSSEVIIVTAYGSKKNAFDTGRKQAFAYIEKEEDNPYDLLCLKVEEAIKNKDRVLAIDDEAEALKNIVRFLKKEGFCVDSASNASDALNLIKVNDFDIVVTDMRMEDGKSGAYILHAAKEKNKFTEVIILTGFGSIQDAVDLTKKGAFAYIEKEADDTYDLLCSKVKEALKNREESKVRHAEIEEAINILIQKMERGLIADVKTILEATRNKNPKRLENIVNQLNELIVKGAVAGTSGNLLYELIKKILGW